VRLLRRPPRGAGQPERGLRPRAGACRARPRPRGAARPVGRRARRRGRRMVRRGRPARRRLGPRRGDRSPGRRGGPAGGVSVPGERKLRLTFPLARAVLALTAPVSYRSIAALKARGRAGLDRAAASLTLSIGSALALGLLGTAALLARRAAAARGRWERALRECEGRVRALADSIPGLGWMARPDGSVFWDNTHWY